MPMNRFSYEGKSKVELQRERDEELERKRARRNAQKQGVRTQTSSSSHQKPFISGNSRLALFRKSQRTPWASAKLLQCAWRQLAARRRLDRLRAEARSRRKEEASRQLQGLASGRRVRTQMYAAEAEEPAVTVVRALRRQRQKLIVMDSLPSLAPRCLRSPRGRP